MIAALARRLLIVDDHPSFRESARLLLSAEGYEVVSEVGDGAAALAAASALKPDVVLLDIRLPDADGFVVAAQLTAGPRGPVVVLTSTREDAALPHLVRESGARGFIPKAKLSGAAIDALLE
jgi:DNA-binding NarL/FixJ family response regulator